MIVPYLYSRNHQYNLEAHLHHNATHQGLRRDSLAFWDLALAAMMIVSRDGGNDRSSAEQ
jgi:hypothetical protein